MPKTDAEKALETLRALMLKYRELGEQRQQIMNEVDRVLGGEPGIGVLLKRIEDHWSRLWSVRYGGAYVWTYVKDRPHTKRLIASIGVEELEGRMISYMQNTDPFFVRTRHSFAAFVATVNQHPNATAQVAAVDGWTRVLEQLEMKLNRHAFFTWFKPTRLLREDGETLVVGVPDQTFGDWLQKHHWNQIHDAVEVAHQRSRPVIFEVTGQ